MRTVHVCRRRASGPATSKTPPSGARRRRLRSPCLSRHSHSSSPALNSPGPSLHSRCPWAHALMHLLQALWVPGQGRGPHMHLCWGTKEGCIGHNVQ